MSPEALQFLVLVPVAFAAGCVDAIAGGGGLLTLPMMALMGIDPLGAIATNKLQGTFGSGSATLAFARAGHIEAAEAPSLGIAAMSGSVLGALAVSYVPQAAIATGLPFLLTAVALYFALSPRLGDVDRHRRVSKTVFLAGFVPAIGFYDGLFGPGAGSFYMVGFVGLLGLGLVRAVARTKLANFASNIAGLVTFAFGGHILWALGLCMGVAQFVGARLGSRLAMRHGARLVKPLLVTISLILAVKLATAPHHPIRLWVENALGAQTAP